MNRFTDKFSVLFLSFCLGFFAYGLMTGSGPTGYILQQVWQVITEPLFPAAVIVAAICLIKINVLVVVVLAVGGYVIAVNWPVEDFVQLFVGMSAPQATGGYFGSQIAWLAYAFLVLLVLIDVLRIASSVTFNRPEPGIRR